MPRLWQIWYLITERKFLFSKYPATALSAISARKSVIKSFKRFFTQNPLDKGIFLEASPSVRIVKLSFSKEFPQLGTVIDLCTYKRLVAQHTIIMAQWEESSLNQKFVLINETLLLSKILSRTSRITRI
jgi:hypothetical protein